MMTTSLPRRPPGLKSLPKAWWVKEIAADIYVCGRPTSRQIKYAAEAGFEALVSLYSDDEPSKLGENIVPDTEETKQICFLAGLEFDSLIDKNEEWASLGTVNRFEEAIGSMKRPLLFVGDNITKAAYIALIYFLEQTVKDEHFEPKFNAGDVYTMCAALGMIPVPNEVDELIAEITDDIPDKDDLINIDTDASIWTNYWPVNHISKNWFTAGQIRRDEIEPIKAAGFKSIVNMRLGMTNNGKPSQEQVTLLNIPDGIPTLQDMNPYRQDPGFAIQNRIKPKVDNSYVSSDSPVNFETRNVEEFGDDVGFNEEIEKAFFKETDFDYCHFPLISGGIYDKSMFDNMKDTLLEFANKGPVLLHCRSARRVAYFGVLIAAVQEGRSLQWAVKRVAEMGFPIGPDQNPHTYKMYCDVLG